MICRFCNTPLQHVFIDLIASPPSNSFLKPEQLNEPETYYPLKVFTCDNCLLVQIDEHKKAADIFSEDYVYFSSMSLTWLRHSEEYVNMISRRLGLGGASHVIEIASNDGYLLQYFKRMNVPCLGIEPTASTAAAAREKGIPVIEDFFGVQLATTLKGEGRTADLILGNNVLAHVPDINDFVRGLGIALKPSGTITMEFPHLMQLVSNNQFDTIYHEHFSYFSLHTVQRIFALHGLTVYDVEEIPVHGGSLRIFARHAANAALPVLPQVDSLLVREREAGMLSMDYYALFQESAETVKLDLLRFLVAEKSNGRRIAAYGAAAKGNTLLNFCGVKNDLIEFVADKAQSKQGRFLPGSHIPVLGEGMIRTHKPDYVIILPWNIRDEIMNQLAYIRDWDGKFVIPIPRLEIM